MARTRCKMCKQVKAGEEFVKGDVGCRECVGRPAHNDVAPEVIEVYLETALLNTRHSSSATR